MGKHCRTSAKNHRKAVGHDCPPSWKKKIRQRVTPSRQNVCFDVKPGSFEPENIKAAVKRYHVSFIGERKNIIEATKEFAPFQPYALQAWETVLELLDSEVIENRWAAAALMEHLDPLDETKVGQLIERLHADNNRSLATAVAKQKISPRQCQDLCDRLCNGEFVRSENATNRDDYRGIVIQHGTDQQLWQLTEQGEDLEQSSAISALRHRGLIDESDPRAYQGAAADLLSGHFGRVTHAKFTFAKSEDAQSWFFQNIDSLPKTHRWAIVEAMDNFSADLTQLQSQLFAQIDVEENAVLQAKLIGLAQHFSNLDAGLVVRLTSVLNDDATSLHRAAVVRVLGSWLSNPAVSETVYQRLLPILSDESARVRQIAVDQIAKEETVENENVVRDSLRDPDPENVRRAMWHLSRMGAMTDEDLEILLDEGQPDRLAAETVLATTIHPAPLVTVNLADVSGNSGPLTESLLRWRQSQVR